MAVDDKARRLAIEECGLDVHVVHRAPLLGGECEQQPH
jgi:hypothetical protein